MPTPNDMPPLFDTPPADAQPEPLSPEELDRLTADMAKRIVNSADPHAMDQYNEHLDSLADPDRPGQSGAQQIIGGRPDPSPKPDTSNKARRRGIGGHGPDAADDPHVTAGEPERNPQFISKEQFFGGMKPESANKWGPEIRNRKSQQ